VDLLLDGDRLLGAEAHRLFDLGAHVRGRVLLKNGESVVFLDAEDLRSLAETTPFSRVRRRIRITANR